MGNPSFVKLLLFFYSTCNQKNKQTNLPLEQVVANDLTEPVQVWEQQRQEHYEDYQQHGSFFLPLPRFDSIHLSLSADPKIQQDLNKLKTNIENEIIRQ